ncbi:MAG: hypothetical protein ACRDPK_12880 [Carbonactinosporaceae bacterium]
MLPALLTACYAAVLAVAAHLGRPAFAAALVFAQVVFAVGWFRLAPPATLRSSRVIAILAGLAADAAVFADEIAPGTAPMASVLGIAFVLVLVQQLARRDGRGAVTTALTMGVSGVVLTSLAAWYLAAWSVGSDLGGRAAEDTAAMIVSAVIGGICAATLIGALPLPGPVTGTLGLLGAAGAGVLLEVPLGAGGLVPGMVLAACGGGLALVARTVIAYGSPAREARLSAGVMLPFVLAAPAAYVVGRFLVA